MSMDNPAHPGEILRVLILLPQDISVTQAAAHLNVNRKSLSRILSGRGPVSPEMAVRLEKVFSKPSADHWMRLQGAYDLWQVRQNVSEIRVVPWEAAAK